MPKGASASLPAGSSSAAIAGRPPYLRATFDGSPGKLAYFGPTSIITEASTSPTKR